MVMMAEIAMPRRRLRVGQSPDASRVERKTAAYKLMENLPGYGVSVFCLEITAGIPVPIRPIR